VTCEAELKPHFHPKKKKKHWTGTWKMVIQDSLGREEGQSRTFHVHAGEKGEKVSLVFSGQE
jgi:hypothetical protein